jgi:hypothetical protein
MNNIDDWLNALGIEEQPPEQPQQSPLVPAQIQPEEEPAIAEEPPIQHLSENDFDDILSDLGFTEPQEAEIIEEAETIEEEPTPTISVTSDTTEVQELEQQEESPVVSAELNSAPLPTTPLIPENSPSLLVDETTSRFSGAEWYNVIQSSSIIIAGCGGIGSNAALQLARLHPHAIWLYDDDRVERGNMSGQMFESRHVGRPKVDAVYEVLHDFTNCPIVRCIRKKWDADSSGNSIMIGGFDNMSARRTFFESWKNYMFETGCDKKECLFIDGRLNIDTLQVFCIQGNDERNIERYENEFLFSDAEAEETVCSLKQTTYMACMIGAVITNLFVNFMASTLDPVIPYDLPFFTEYNAQFMLFKTEH